MPSGKFDFSGSGAGMLWLCIWTTVLTICTLGLFWPWAMSATVKWIAERSSIDGKQLTFKGTGAGFFGTFLLILVLTVVTLGIYSPWGICRFYRWIINNLYFAESGDAEKF